MIVKGEVSTAGCGQPKLCGVHTPVGCALRVSIKCRRDEERGDESDDEMHRRGGGEHAAETNAQVDP